MKSSRLLVVILSATAVLVDTGRLASSAEELVQFSGAASEGVHVTSPSQQREATGREVSKGELEAIRRERGIESVARHVGHYKASVRLDKDVVALDLATIAYRSDIVVRGTVISSESAVSHDRTSIITDYLISVAEVFDGTPKSGDAVTLRLPGGRLKFKDGSVAEIEFVAFRGLEVGHEYLLFLARSREEPGASRYELAWGTQGTFELTPEATVLPLGATWAEVPKLYANKPVTALLDDTRAAIITKRKLQGRLTYRSAS